MAGRRPFAPLDFEDACALNEARDALGLGLGLTLGAGAGLRSVDAEWGRSTKDLALLGSRGSPRASSTSSVSSSSPPRGDLGGGTKRIGADVTDGSSPLSQSHMVVGWPPVGSFRVNNLFNQFKDVNTLETEAETVDAMNKASQCCSYDNSKGKMSKDWKSRGQSVKSSLLVKVNMDGDPIGRKVDLNAHHSYENLAVTLDLMFHNPHGAKASKLLDGSSAFALTYEDKDGDFMLLGDVPWEMFLDTVKRLRIMKTSDANVLAPRFELFSKANGFQSTLLKMRKPDQLII